MQLNINNMLYNSHANGPGCRFVVWFQGCQFNCPGCFNPDTHSFESRIVMDTNDVVSNIARHMDNIEGVTISGGEPLCQPEGLLEMLQKLREKSSLSMLLFSGYAYEEIVKQSIGEKILSYTDVLIDGPYDKSRHAAKNLLGSFNQRILFLSNRYCLEDFQDIPLTEITITPEGHIILTGIQPLY